MKKYRGIGVMTGTSMDGIDLVAAEFWEAEGKWNYEIEAVAAVPLDEKWYARLRCLDTADARTYARTDVYFGHYLGKNIAEFIKRFDLRPDLVASHGQTIFHEPHRNYTGQIGDGETIVAYLPCPLVTNFRNKDIALGGQGAPLVPFGEIHLFPQYEAFLNLGGFANLSLCLEGKDPVAFDVAAANVALNWLTRTLDPPLPYDPDGQLAKQGQLNGELFEALEGLEYYERPAPKSLGVEWFEAEVLPLLVRSEASVPDQLHTYVHHLATRVLAEVDRAGCQGELLVTGGGAYNKFFMEKLEEGLKERGFGLAEVGEELIEGKEALIFAFLGLQTLLGRPNLVHSVTGAQYSTVGGSIHLPGVSAKPYI